MMLHEEGNVICECCCHVLGYCLRLVWSDIFCVLSDIGCSIDCFVSDLGLSNQSVMLMFVQYFGDNINSSLHQKNKKIKVNYTNINGIKVKNIIIWKNNGFKKLKLNQQ